MFDWSEPIPEISLAEEAPAWLCNASFDAVSSFSISKYSILYGSCIKSVDKPLHSKLLDVLQSANNELCEQLQQIRKTCLVL